MYIAKYVKTFGQYSFEERPFSDVDATVLARAVYANLEVVAPSIHNPYDPPVKFKDIHDFDMEVVTAGKILVAKNTPMVRAMRTSKRFGNVAIKYVYKILNKEVSNQFYACTFEVPGVGLFIAFRGTDASIIGWKENLHLSTHSATLSQLDAADYINVVASKEQGKPLYIGGHSKGGNLALYGGIHCDEEVKKSIVKIYSLDGNGLKSRDIYSTKQYLDVKDKIVFIKPVNTIVGSIMYNPKSKLNVKTSTNGLYAHDASTWKIDNKTGEFIFAKSLSKKAIIRHKGLIIWLDKVPLEDLSLLIDLIINVFGEERTVFHFILRPLKIAHIIKVYKSFPLEQRLRMRNAKKKLDESFKEAKKIVNDDLKAKRK